MASPRPPTYAAISSFDDYGATSNSAGEDTEAQSSGTFSAAASPYWNAPIQKAVSKQAKNPSGFSPFVAFCFTINYILGAGFLTIPWAFVQSGLVLSSIMLILSGIGSDISKNLYVSNILGTNMAIQLVCLQPSQFLFSDSHTILVCWKPCRERKPCWTIKCTGERMKRKRTSLLANECFCDLLQKSNANDCCCRPKPAWMIQRDLQYLQHRRTSNRTVNPECPNLFRFNRFKELCRKPI